MQILVILEGSVVELLYKRMEGKVTDMREKRKENS